VNSFVGDHVAAGGHQGYAALGGLYTQARPMVPHLYGNVADQAKLIPVSFLFPVYFIILRILSSTTRHSLGLLIFECQAFRRLCQMTSRERREVINPVGIQNDKLIALGCIKRQGYMV
jgi:hypothetical protein